MFKAFVAAACLLTLGATTASAESEPYLSEINQFSFGFCPSGWLPTDGRTMPINLYTALFALLGTTYGGDGINNFKLPNFAGIPTKVPGQSLTTCIAVVGVFPSRN
jgi:microcystin-dependent protein